MNRRDFLRLAVAAPAVAASKHLLPVETAKAAGAQFPRLAVQFADVTDAAEMGWSLSQAAQAFDLVVGTSYLFTPQNVAILKAGKPKWLGLYRHPYMWSTSLDNASLYTEEMFLHNAQGNRIPTDEGGFYFNPGNAAFRAFFAASLASYMTLGLDGVFLDGPAIDFAPTPTWHGDTLQLLNAVRAALPGKVIITNSLMSYTPSGQGTEYDFAPFVDGYSLEMFMSTFPWAPDPSQAYDPDVAHATIAASKNVVALGKHVDLFSGFTFNPNPAVRAQWKAFQYAGYLMLVQAGGTRCYWSWGYNRAEEYDFPGLHLNLGQPLGPAVRNGDVYTRNFEHYDVTCDLNTVTGTFQQV